MNHAAIDCDVAVLEAPRRLVWRRESLRSSALGARDVLCGTEVSVISPGTELAAYVGAPPLRPGVVYPRLMGYCNVARVLACGTDVQGIAPGDRVLTFSSHRSHFIVPADDVLAIVDPKVESEDAGCAYLFHLGYSAILAADVRLGSTVVVIGLGALGLGAVATSVLAGARTLAVSDHVHPQTLARSFGAESVHARADFAALLTELGEMRADVVVTTSNSWADWALALESAGFRGTIAVLGFPGRQESQVPTNPLDSRHFYARQLRIVAAGLSPERADGRGFLRFHERANLGRILHWIGAGRLHPRSILSGEYASRRLGDAYEALLARNGSPVTYLLRWNTGS